LNRTLQSAVQFLRDAVAYYNRLGVTIKRLLTDNGSAFRSKPFRQACQQLGITQNSPVPTGRKPMARPSASSSQRCGRGPMAGRTRTPRNRQALHSWQHHYN